MVKTIKNQKAVNVRPFRENYMREVSLSCRKKPDGLCLTCNNYLNCTFTRDPKRPVLFCEEFDDFTAPIVNVTRLSAFSDNRPDDGEKDTDKYKGLCVNCENRTTCNLPKPASGVWHCEEYL
jgi:hypothetical protein